MTRTELISHVLHGVRTGQIVAWLDDDGEIRLITAEQATAAHWRVALGVEAVAAMVSCNNGCGLAKNSWSLLQNWGLTNDFISCKIKSSNETSRKTEKSKCSQ